MLTGASAYPGEDEVLTAVPLVKVQRGPQCAP